MFVDTHSHIYSSEFSLDRDEVITRALRSGVERIVLPNIDSSSLKPMLDLTDSVPGLFYPLIGLHPTSVKEDYKNELQILEYWMGKRKFYGVGEIGIDLYWDKSFFDEQVDAFKTQIGWAKKQNLPVIIHVRDSFNETFQILKEEYTPGLSGIFHSFTGTAEQAKEVIDMGFKLGANGIVTFKNSGLDDVFGQIDLKHVVIETDSPWLAPAPHRGKRNECSYIQLVAEKLAALHGTTVKEVATVTTRNAQEIFHF